MGERNRNFPIKGTVTSLSSLFSPSDAQLAVQRVEDTISSYKTELHRVNQFVLDNTNLINLIQRLPDETHHNIMVPFGKAAFFEGRLVHTNEFKVLLGEGYYADRTAKQTGEILKRRGKVLESQVESLKAMLQDLKAEASFFDATASEAAEGLVEIREDYVEEGSTKEASGTGLPHSDSSSPIKPENANLSYEDLMANLDELEREEEAEYGSDHDEDGGHGVEDDEQVVEDEEYARLMSKMDELLRLEEIEEKELMPGTVGGPMKAGFDHFQNDKSHYHDLKSSGMSKSVEITEAFPSKDHCQQTFADLSEKSELQFRKVIEQPVPKDKVNQAYRESILILPEEKNNSQGFPTSAKDSSKSSKPGFDSLKAFTGSIVEHTHGLQTDTADSTNQSSGSKPSKPLSRFKMQRR